MKRSVSILIFLVAILSAFGEQLVILQTNDTHSQLDPTTDGFGGLARRKVLIDSIRAAEPNVLLVDCGDAVQGTLYFNVFKGDAEQRAMEMLGYDYAILGNHDFDNGAADMSRLLHEAAARGSHVERLSSNYRFAPELGLDSICRRYAVRDIGGKRIGVIALNLVPRGMIAEGCYEGVEYLDAVKAANALAWYLRHVEGADMVVALSHLGYGGNAYPTDHDVVGQTEGIDILLGGHSHTDILPGSGREWLANAVGDSVLVVQSGSSGVKLAQVTVDLDSIGLKRPQYKQYAVSARLDARVDPAVEAFLRPYRQEIAKQMGETVGYTRRAYTKGELPMLNYLSDVILEEGSRLLGREVDLALMNKGSLRAPVPQGAVSKGDILALQPFNNRLTVIEISGGDLREALEVMARRGGDGVSRGVEVVYDDDGEIELAQINGRELDDDATYTVATIDYLANGGDYMEPLRRARQIAQSPRLIRDDLLRHLSRNPQILPSEERRMRPED